MAGSVLIHDLGFGKPVRPRSAALFEIRYIPTTADPRITGAALWSRALGSIRSSRSKILPNRRSCDENRPVSGWSVD